MATFLSTSASWCRKSAFAFLPQSSSRRILSGTTNSASLISTRTTLLGSSDDHYDISAAPASKFAAVARRTNNFLHSPSRYTYSYTPPGMISSSSSSSRLFSATATNVEEPSTTMESESEEEIELPTNDNDINLLKIRHTSAHVMAMAVQRLYPEAQVTIGPWISNGFYYDFYFPETTNSTTGEVIPSRKLNDEDLKQIKKAMDKIISADLPILREEVSRDEARSRIQSINEPFKLEILDSIQTEPITIYSIGENNEWWDLCAGPHVERTGQLPKKAIALESVAGAYWRGDESREMLQRIYATAWKDPTQLKLYKQRMEEAKKRDHRVLGKKLDLFSIQVRGYSICLPMVGIILSYLSIRHIIHHLMFRCHGIVFQRNKKQINRRMPGVVSSSGIPRAPRYDAKSKTFGRRPTSTKITTSSTRHILPISTYGKLRDITISTERGCLIKWMSRMRYIKSNR